jgi:hypothetical protein
MTPAVLVNSQSVRLSTSTPFNPNMFNASEEPMLTEAFGAAWRALTAQQADPESDPGSIALQCRIASAIMVAASKGIIDPALMAKAAIERCSAARTHPSGGASQWLWSRKLSKPVASPDYSHGRTTKALKWRTWNVSQALTSDT